MSLKDIQHNNCRIQFAQANSSEMENAQDELYFHVIADDGCKEKIGFHNYNKIYRIPGLYEKIFYEHFRCCSPQKLADILRTTIKQEENHTNTLRVLDFGAGNGIMGEILRCLGVEFLVGVDIIREAKDAAERDRPHTYDDYYVLDFCDLSDDRRETLKSGRFNCLTTVSALGFGDIPPFAFIEAFNLIEPGGWIGFNIKDTFLNKKDSSGFSRLIRELIFSQYLDIYHLERYLHRWTIDDRPLYYYAFIGRKQADVTLDDIKKTFS